MMIVLVAASAGFELKILGRGCMDIGKDRIGKISRFAKIDKPSGFFLGGVMG